MPSSDTKNRDNKTIALTRVQKYMTPGQNTFSTSSLIQSQFNYCPLIWMFCSKVALHRFNNMHERFLRLIHQDYVSNFITLFVNANEKSIYLKDLEFLMIEISKYLNGPSLQIMNVIFKLRKNTCNLINDHLFKSQNSRTKQYGLDCIAYIASLIWHFFSTKSRHWISL